MKDNYNIGANIGVQQIINEKNFRVHGNPTRRVLSSPPRMVADLDREASLDRIAGAFAEEKPVVVIHGAAGTGKRTLANRFFYERSADYEQIGWVDLESDLHLDSLRAFSFYTIDSKDEIPESTFRVLAERQRNDLVNHEVKRLLVITGVHDWAMVSEFLAFLELPGTDYLITAETSFNKALYPRFTQEVVNLLVPEFGFSEVEELLDKYHAERPEDPLLRRIKSNLFLRQLLIDQAPIDNPGDAYEYLRRVTSGANTVVDVIVNLLGEGTLFGPEVWLLFQFAALPDDRYDVDRLAELLFYKDLRNSPEDLTTLVSYEIFSYQIPGFEEDYDNSLSGLCENLMAKSWLTATEGSYRLHPLLRLALRKKYFKEGAPNSGISVDLFTELMSTLQRSFFVDERLLFTDLDYLRHVMALLKFVPAQPHRELTDMYRKVADIKYTAGRWVEELPLRRVHFSLVDGLREEELVLSSLGKLVFCLQQNGNYNECHRQAITLARRGELAGLQFFEFLGYWRAGNALEHNGNLHISFQHLEKARMLGEKIFDALSINLSLIYNSLGVITTSLGEFNVALVWLEKARKIVERAIPEDNSSLALTYFSIGQVKSNLGKYSAALTWLEKARQIYEEVLPEDHSYLAITYQSIGRVKSSIGEYSAALAWLEKALQTFEIVFSEDHSELASTYHSIGQVKSKLGEYTEAKAFLVKAREIKEKIFPADHPSLAITFRELGITTVYQGNKVQGFAYLHRALKIYKERTEPISDLIAITEGKLGLAHLHCEEQELAKPLLEGAIKKLDQVGVAKTHYAHKEFTAALKTMVEER